jgi:hypothetical protein
LIDDDLDLQEDGEEEVEEEIDDSHINDFSEYEMPNLNEFEEQVDPRDVRDSEVAPELTSLWAKLEHLSLPRSQHDSCI